MKRSKNDEREEGKEDHHDAPFAASYARRGIAPETNS